MAKLFKSYWLSKTRLARLALYRMAAKVAVKRARAKRARRARREKFVADLVPLRQLFILPHIDSYNDFVSMLPGVFGHIRPIKVTNPITGDEFTVRVCGVPHLMSPEKEETKAPLFPFECREEKISYTGKLTIVVQFKCGHVKTKFKIDFGQLPIMLMSNYCNLRGYNPQLLLSHKEESTEMGGYFILDGIETVIPPVIVPRQNYPMSIMQSDPLEGCTVKAVMIRCLRSDLSSVTVNLYNRLDGTRLGVRIQGKDFLLPVGLFLKALTHTTNEDIMTKVRGCTDLIRERMRNIMAEVSKFGPDECLEYIGSHFQSLMGMKKNEHYSNVGDAFLNEYILVHLSDNRSKFDLLIFMLQKLFSFVDEISGLDNPDSLQHQEVLLPGQLMSIYLKEKLEDWLQRTKTNLLDEIKVASEKISFCCVNNFAKVLDKSRTTLVCSDIETMLKNGLDSQQGGGLTVQAERLDISRFLSQFRAIRQRAFSDELCTTSVGGLFPESPKGFLCTLDGESQCLQMTPTCRITSDLNVEVEQLVAISDALAEKGMTPKKPWAGPPDALSVVLDGEVIGFISSNQVEQAVDYLRMLKVTSASLIPDDLEVGYVPVTTDGAYPGLYLFTTPFRLVRPVKNISIPVVKDQNDIELIGPFEQAFRELRYTGGRDGGRKEDFSATYEEIHPTGVLSVVANLTPSSEQNQSSQHMVAPKSLKDLIVVARKTAKLKEEAEKAATGGSPSSAGGNGGTQEYAG